MVLAALCVTSAGAVGEWPMERHDRQLTGRTALKGDMREAPQVVARHYLGVWRNYLELRPDDASREALELHEREFNTGYLGTDRQEWGVSVPRLDLTGAGHLVEAPNAAGTKIAKLLPDVAGLQRVEFDSAFALGAENTRGRLYAYPNGPDDPQLVWETDAIKDMYSPVIALADTDLDGQLDIVMMTQYHLAVYDARTGEVKDRVEWNVGRNYGQLDVVDVDGDGYPDFVVQADAPAHLEFIRNGPDGARLEWSHKYLADEADVAVPTDFMLHNLPNSVGDLDGDGRVELAVNIHDLRGERRWRVVVFDVITGDVRFELPGSYLWGVEDLDGDGHHELFLSEVEGKTVDRSSPLSVARYVGADVETLWRSDGVGKFSMRPYHFSDSANSAASRGPAHRSTVVTGDAPSGSLGNLGRVAYLTLGSTLHAVGVEGLTSFTVTATKDTAPAAIATRGSGVRVEVPSARGAVTVTGASGSLVSCVRSSGYRGSVSVADIDADGHNEVIVADEAGFIRVLDFVDGELRLRWKRRAFGQPVWTTWSATHAAAPAVDLDGDGRKEIICSDAGDEAASTIYALRSDGSVMWASELPMGPRLIETFSVGRFRPDGWDVIVTVSPKTQPEMLCLDGRDGTVLWHHRTWEDDDGKSWPYPNQYVCFDSDGDGFDEIHGSYAYIYYRLDGTTGLPLRKPLHVVNDVFGRWQSYFAPVPGDYNGDGETEYFLASGSGSVGGVSMLDDDAGIVWEHVLDNATGARGYQGIGDCDGDGLPEIAFCHLDGRVTCYDGATGDVRWEVPGVEPNHSNSGGHFAAADIDGDGRDEFIYPSGSRELIALSETADGHILWRVQLPAEPETPIIADVDGDGRAEILVVTTDGFLNVLK
jgi:hypothetical protein